MAVEELRNEIQVRLCNRTAHPQARGTIHRQASARANGIASSHGHYSHLIRMWCPARPSIFDRSPRLDDLEPLSQRQIDGKHRQTSTWPRVLGRRDG